MNTVAGVGALVIVVMVAAPARAEHNTPAAPPPAVEGPASSLDIDVNIGVNGFRLGSRVFGRDGYAGGAWLNGEAGPDGFSLDGRLERGGKAHSFKLNARIDEWVRRAARWWGAGSL